MKSKTSENREIIEEASHHLSLEAINSCRKTFLLSGIAAGGPEGAA
jgi:hypothetical protein